MAGALLLLILSILALFAAGHVARGTNTALVMFWLLVATILLSAVIPDARAIKRPDTKAVLGVTSDRYAVIQNTQAAAGGR